MFFPFTIDIGLFHVKTLSAPTIDDVLLMAFRDRINVWISLFP